MLCVFAGWNRGGGEGGAGRGQRAQPAEHPRRHHGEFWGGTFLLPRENKP